MNLYFAGGSSDENLNFIRKNNCNQLLSQLNERSKIIEWVLYLRQHPECESKLFVDSGAWTAYTKNKKIDIDDYIKFINDYGDKVTIFASIDKIPGEYGREPTKDELLNAPKESWENYLYMWERIKYKDKLIPVFHYGESFDNLDFLLNYHHSDGTPIKYIGLGGVADVKNMNERDLWFQQCFKRIKSSNNPNICTHAFGMTSTELLTKFPFTSADSTTWLKAATFGELIVNNKRVKISERTQLQNSSFELQNPEYKQCVTNIINQLGFTIQELMTDATKRLLFNLVSVNNWAKNYVCDFQVETHYEEELF